MTTSQTPCAPLRKPPQGLFGRLLDSLIDIYVLVLDRDHLVTYTNISFLEHFDLRWEEIGGRPCDLLGKLFQGTDAVEVGFCPNELSPLYPAKTILTREAEGKVNIYESTIYQLHGPDQAAWTVWSLRDVSDRFRLESQVRQMDDLERNLVQASMDGIIANDMLGNVLIFNQGAARILGYAPEEVIGKVKVYKFYPDKVAHEIKSLIYDPGHGGAGILENYETQVLHKDGTPIPIWLSARLLHEDSREVGIVGYFKDLRERQRLETAVLRNERLATLGKMVARISHEIRNPLVTIGGFAGQLKRTAGLPEGARRKLTLIYQEVQRLEKFLSDMSTFSKSSPPQKVMADLPALVREVAELMEDSFQERGVAFRLETRSEIPPFAFDPGQIRQVLINLFKNGLESMDKGGELRVTADPRSDHIVLTITDTGHGIPADQLPNLFTPFFTTKEGGTGLGLTIVQGLITQHQGEISIDSIVGRGTTCTIRLPLAAA